MSKGKGQQVMEHSLFPLEFKLPDGKDIFQTVQRCYQLKIHPFYKCQTIIDGIRASRTIDRNAKKCENCDHLGL